MGIRDWVPIYALERNADDEEWCEHVGVAYWDEERGRDEANRHRCDLVRYEVNFDSAEVVMRAQPKPGRYTVALECAQDGTITAHGGDIQGLDVEAATLAAADQAVRAQAPTLLEAHHGLTAKESAAAEIVYRIARPGAGKEA